ncbi:long-chain-fatty-acid--CoA ligase ACSBG2-like isoform X1 [Rhinatrema bivittatum]|uniref:long-chain-fatty-acid--CoA ligase ACSBG2-like isoform X1 n=1 Tax=Rhinatrema bivittatum TaxID=194408 RepID=UPI00112A024D|nr:long-chain-fatty-acid--CoA ligase ACSBG2-like isoform X1 [Rhinatrema bivittatum]
MLVLNRILSCTVAAFPHGLHANGRLLSSCRRFRPSACGDAAARARQAQVDPQEESEDWPSQGKRGNGSSRDNSGKRGRNPSMATKLSRFLHSERASVHPAAALACHLSTLPSTKDQDIPEQSKRAGGELGKKLSERTRAEEQEGSDETSKHEQRKLGSVPMRNDVESAPRLTGDRGWITDTEDIPSPFRGGLSSVALEDHSIASKLAPADSLWTTEKDRAVRLRMAQTGYGAEPPITVHELFQQTLQRYSNWPALAAKRDGQWETITYLQYYQQCRAAAKGFLKLGLERFHGVGILGFNSPEWLIADIGAIMAGGFAAGIYSTSSPEVCQHMAENCEANILVVEDHQQLTKILQIQHKLPQLKAIIQYHGELQEKRPNLYTWEELMQLGSDVQDSQLDEIISSQKANQCCTLIYTSGTTGNPKGVMLSHDNVTWSMRAFGNTLGLGEEEVGVSYLPLSHIAAQALDIWMPLIFGGTTYFGEPENLKGSLVTTLQEVRPTFFLGMPRVWEKIMESIKTLNIESSVIKRKATDWARDIGLRANYNHMNGINSVPWGYSLADRLVLKKIHVAVGLDRCKVCSTGAAPISKDTLEYFMSVNLPIYEVYGMSESSGPHTVSNRKNFRITSCGKELLGCRTRIDKPDKDDNGEVCYWGRDVFMGYLNMKDRTEEALDEEGWLHSGDIGKLDQEGFLYITGRIKELIITAGGKNIPPVPTEEAVKEELPILSNAMLIGDKRRFLSMLLTLKCNVDPNTGEPQDELTPEAVQFCQQLGSRATRVSEVITSEDPAVYKAIQEGIERVNRRAVSNAHRVQKWTILSKDFSIYGGELSLTMKLKRAVVLQLYQDKIDAFYKF